MKLASHKKPFFKSKYLLIDHVANFKYLSGKLLTKHKKDENEQKLIDFISDKEKFKIKPFYNQEEIVIFLSSKAKAMEKMNLDDEGCLEGKIETRKINIDKSIFPKSKHSNNKKVAISPKKKLSIKNHSIKKFGNKSNNKNIIINANGKIEKTSMKSIDLDDYINLNINKEIKGNNFDQLFSNKALLTSIINEIKEK